MNQDTGSPGSPNLSVLGPEGGRVRFELALAEGSLEEREDPFVALSDAAPHARVLLGRIAAGEKGTVRPLAVKVQRSAYRPGKGALANPQIDELWERERENLVRAGGGGVVALLDLGPGAFRNRPVTFCKKVRKYFHPPCPRCRGPLADCRDDALLRDHGLPEYSKSAVRYLACGSCKGRRTFYTTSAGGDEALRGEAEVRRKSDLYRDFGAIVREKLPEEERRRLAAGFPCLECPHTSECYPAGTGPAPAESRLVPLSYYEFHLLPLEAAELHYDEFCDLLGGASWEKVRERARSSGGPGREVLLRDLDGVYAGQEQYLYARDVSGRFALEVLRLKLALFSQVSKALRRHHALCRQPHLDLGPGRVMVRGGAGGSGLPARWGFDARLIGLGSPHRAVAGATANEAGWDLLAPAPGADPTYVSPFARERGGGHEEAVRVSIRKVEAQAGGFRLEGVVSSERARLDAHLPGDVVRVAASGAVGGVEHLAFWGRLGEREERALKFAAVLPGKVAGLTPAKKLPDFDAAAVFTRNLHVPCDLYGLGQLLFRALLVNDERDVFAVDDAVQRVLKKLSLWHESQGSPAAARVAEELGSLLEGEREVFGSSAVLHGREDREERPSAVPPSLWSALLALGFRLLTSFPGFGFCASHADYPADRPEAVMDRVLGEVALLETRVHVELFGRSERDLEIWDACAELIGQVTGGRAAPAEA